MATTLRETVLLKTPQGHDVLAELNYEQFGILRAKVVHNYTGVTKALDSKTIENLARALRAKQIYELALSETRSIEEKLAGFSPAVIALGAKHPALEPYWHEIEKHRAIAADMSERARHFHDDAMHAIDKIAGD